jgi:DNA-binding NtrC family response regulator
MSKKSLARRVLVIDDEPLIRWSLAETLAERGFEVNEAEDARSAVQIVSDAADPFAVMVLDLRLPDSHDLTLLSRLRRLAPESRVILMTAYSTPKVAQSALDLGAFRVVSKPFEINELAALISKAGVTRPSS